MSHDEKRTIPAIPEDSQPANPQRPSGTGRRTQTAALVVLGALVLAFLIVLALRLVRSHELATETARVAAAAAEVDVATVKAAAPTRLLTLPGETAAWYEATIYARVDGYVSHWYVDIGDHVKAGQVLAEIDTPDLDAQLAAARAKLTTAEADVEVRQAQSEFAGTTYKRWKESPKGVVSEQETADKKADYESARATVMAAQADVKQAQGDVDKYLAFEQFKKVTAPFNGVITQRRVDIGNLVTAGSTAPTTMLYRMTQNQPIRVFVDAPQDAVSWMTVGSPVDVVTSGTGERVFSGTITRTSDAVDPQSRTLRVEADIANKDHALVPGLYVNASFHLRSEGTSEVPAAALMIRPRGAEVAVVADGRVQFRPVKIAEDDGTTVNLASGVQVGDQIVLNINSQIADGSPVDVVMVDGKPVAGGNGKAR